MQIPPHPALAGTLVAGRSPFAQPGTTGLFVLPLPTTANRGAFTPLPITGLPADLTVTPNLGTLSGRGVYAVAHRAADGTVFAGSFTDGSVSAVRTVQIHVMTLNGLAVSSSFALQVWRVDPGYLSGVGSLSLLSDGRKRPTPPTPTSSA